MLRLTSNVGIIAELKLAERREGETTESDIGNGQRPYVEACARHGNKADDG